MISFIADLIYFASFFIKCEQKKHAALACRFFREFSVCSFVKNLKSHRIERFRFF